ncbi:MAG: fibronectin type III domain-containing protein [Limisphaerales bacterium]
MSFNLNQKTRYDGKTRRRFSRLAGLARFLIGITLLVTLHNPLKAFSDPLPELYDLTLAWDPNPSPDVIGYHLYYGTVSGNLTNSILTGNVTTVTVPGLSWGVTYYFAITTVGTNEEESAFSDEISYRQELPGAQMQIHVASDGQFMLNVAGPVGHAYEIEASEDLSTWTVIGTVFLDSSSSLDFTDTNAMNFSQRFYRTRDTQP